MDQRVEVVYEQASQVLWFQAPEGRPSATPSVEVRDKYGAVKSANADTNVTQDTVNTTVNASASAGDKSLTLAAVTAIAVGRTYLVTNSLSQSERVIVRGINSSTKVVTLDEALEFDYASSDAFVSTRFYYTLQTADVATLDELYQAVAAYSVSGAITSPLRVLFDVVRFPLHNPLIYYVGRDPVKKRWPGLPAQEPGQQEGTDFLDQREEAWSIVLSSVRAAGFRPALIVTADQLRDWTLAELGLLLQEQGIKVLKGLDADAAIERLETRRDTLRQKALSNLDWYDADEDRSKDAGEEEKPLPLDMKR